MAAVCEDSHILFSFPLNREEIFEPLPKIENNIGDIPYFLEESSMLVLTTPTYHPDNCIYLKALSATLILALGVIVMLLGGRVMYYIPLYVALMPIAYWLLKIGYAYFLVKNNKLHTGSTTFTGKQNG